MDTRYANFRGNPIYQATKRHVETIKNEEKWREKKKRKKKERRLILFWLCFYSLFVAWKIVNRTLYFI